MHKPSRLNWQIVDRYLAGQATSEERALVELWLEASPKFRALVAELYRGTVTAADVDEAQEEVRRRLEQDTTQPKRMHWLQVAIALGLIAAALAMLLRR